MKASIPLENNLGIQVNDGKLFHLRTVAASMVIQVSATGHLLLDWFASQLPLAPEYCLRLPGDNEANLPGMVVSYLPTAESKWSLGESALAFSTIGKGDYRTPSVRIADAGVLDFTYRSHRIVTGTIELPGMPQARPEEGTQSLEITVVDDVAQLEVRLIWTCFPSSGMITARTVLRNLGNKEVTCTHLASVLTDLAVDNGEIISFDGHWLGEAKPSRRPVGGYTVNASATGSSSTEHNPGILLVGQDTTEETGWCYGFNLIYSGSHRTTVETSPSGTVRVVSGIHPEGFAWPLATGAELVSPEVLLTYSDSGIGDLSRRMHHFVNTLIVPQKWSGVERPVVMNSWEAVYFDFTADSLLEVAKASAALGAEVFVVDDGWFGERNNDQSSLGDWWVNERRFPGGLQSFANDLAGLGLQLGLWFEPEAVSPDSDLYRTHPDWAIKTAGRVPSQGRFELLLDLTRPEVRDYIVSVVGTILDEVDISFVKWDMNRLICDAPDPGFQHRYQLGLYDILGRIFGPRPEILLETCSSGGNRFDLSMLAFGPQIWASDCTDPIERLVTQRGLSYLYPASTISAHISAVPNHQTGRSTPLSFRFAASAFCTMGLEMDPTTLSQAEATELRERIAWYKEQRTLLQFGELWRLPSEPGCTNLAVVENDQWIVARMRGNVTPRSAQSRFIVPVRTEGEVEVTEAFRQPPVEGTFPAAALRHGILQDRHSLSLDATIYRAWQLKADSADDR